MDKVVPLTSGVPRRDLALGGFLCLTPPPRRGSAPNSGPFPGTDLTLWTQSMKPLLKGPSYPRDICSDPSPLVHHHESGGGVADKETQLKKRSLVWRSLNGSAPSDKMPN